MVSRIGVSASESERRRQQRTAEAAAPVPQAPLNRQWLRSASSYVMLAWPFVGTVTGQRFNRVSNAHLMSMPRATHG